MKPYAAVATLTFAAALVTSLTAAEPLPKRGDFIAMAGDSITFQSRYSLWVEMYLLAARPDLDLRVAKVQRWCGGTADLYAKETLEQELIPTRPNIFTVCFGMNDGGGSVLSEETRQRYATALTDIVERNRAHQTITVLCSPGVVDEFSYENATLVAAAFNSANGTPAESAATKDNASAAIYNRTLAGLRDVARGVAEKQQVPFADIHDAMWRVMQEAKAGYGKIWPPRVSLRWPQRRALVCDDGVHPDTAAHIPMAYAVLKAMGFDGNIGSIELDWASGRVTTDAAQTATLKAPGRIELESSRLPLCFFDDSACSEGYPSIPCRYVLQHCPFQEDLNRYVLCVQGLPNKPVRVTWGDRAVIFTREQLEAGINLASEFPENPFCPAMRALDAAVWKKQVFERTLFGILNVPIWDEHFGNWKSEEKREALRKTLDEFSAWAAKEFPSNRKLLDACESVRQRAVEKGEIATPKEFAAIRQMLWQRQHEYHEKARALVKPVRHVLQVEPVS